MSDSAGNWVTPMYLNSGLDYTIVYKLDGYEVETKEVTIP